MHTTCTIELEDRSVRSFKLQVQGNLAKSEMESQGWRNFREPLSKRSRKGPYPIQIGIPMSGRATVEYHTYYYSKSNEVPGTLYMYIVVESYITGTCTQYQDTCRAGLGKSWAGQINFAKRAGRFR